MNFTPQSVRARKPRKPAPGAAALADANSLPAKFLRRWKDAGGRDVWEREYRFHPERRWKLDLAYRALRVGVELHGGVHANGRHVRGAGYSEDRRKVNAALSLGWRVYELTTGMLDEPDQLALILAAVGQRPSAAASGPTEGRAGA